MISSVKQFIRSGISRLSGPVPPLSVSSLRTIRCRRSEFELVSETNALFHIVTDRENGYFCPCRSHAPLPEYTDLFVDDYFSFITPWPRYAVSDRALLAEALRDPENFEKFTSMGHPLSPDSRCTRFLHTGDGALIGLETDDPDTLERMKHFVRRFAWCQLNAYLLHSAAAPRQYQTLSAGKALATQALAGLLGLEALFPKSEYARFQAEDHRPMFGIYTERARGVGLIDISRERRRAMLTPDLQRCLSDLNLLDAITHEMDHSPNNYFAVPDGSGVFTGLSVFDNNGVGTFSLNRSVRFSSYKGCSPFVRENGIVNRPHLSLETVRRLRSLTGRQLTDALSPWLRPAQILAVRLRLGAVKSAIDRTVRLDPRFLLDRDEWSPETIERELNGQYGKTYLTSYLEDCCVPNL